MSRFLQNVRIRTSGSNPVLRDAGGYWSWPWRGSHSGVTVTEDSALALTSVYRCVVLLASTAAGQPLHVHRELPDGSSERIRTFNTAYLWDRPNPEMTKQTFWEIVVGHEVMGDAFIFVVKNGLDQPLELWPIEPRRVQVGRTRSGRKVYQVDNEIPMVDFITGGEIIHVPNWGNGVLQGISPIKAATQAIALGLSSQEYADQFFSQDSTPAGLITTEQELTIEQSDALAERWEQTHGGLANARRIGVLSNGARFQQVSISPEDAQLLEERKFQKAEIATLFGIPPHMLGDTERSTSWGTGIEEQTRGFIAFTLQAHINRFEQAINDALLRKRQTGRYVKFDLGGLLRGTTLQRYQAYAVGYARWLTANEIRRDEDLPPIAGGDELLAPQNVIPIDQLEEAQGTGGGAPSSLPGAASLGLTFAHKNGNGAKP